MAGQPFPKMLAKEGRKVDIFAHGLNVGGPLSIHDIQWLPSSVELKIDLIVVVPGGIFGVWKRMY